VIRPGSSPIECTANRARNPARGKAQGRIDPQPIACCGIGPQTGAKPRSRRRHHPRPGTPFSIDLLITKANLVTPTKINRGGRFGTNGTWARAGRNVGPPGCGSKPAKGFEPHERRRVREIERQSPLEEREGPLSRPGREDRIVGERNTARRGASVHDPKRSAESEAAALDMAGSLASAMNRFHRYRPRDRSKTAGLASSRSFSHLACEARSEDRTTHPARPPARAMPHRFR